MNWVFNYKEFELLVHVLSEIATTFGFLGIVAVFYQLRQNEKLSQTKFEDSLAREYRDIISQIPVGALLGKSLDEKEYSESFAAFYRYIDLTNEQVCLHNDQRISELTWNNWKDGIKSHIKKPAFNKAWKSISESSNDFQELRLFLEDTLPILEDEYGAMTQLKMRHPESLIWVETTVVNVSGDLNTTDE